MAAPRQGVQASTLNPLLALAAEPAGLCLYLVTLGGFASSTGIWHPRWKISLVRSPWKRAEPLRRFTLNGARPACIRCPVCLEFPPGLSEPLSRPDASLPRRVRASALGWTQAALGCGCPALRVLTRAPMPSVPWGFRFPPPLSPGCAAPDRLLPPGKYGSGQGPAPASCRSPQTTAL